MSNNEGTPLHGDRSAWNIIDHAGEHARDIDDNSGFEYHTPKSNYDATTAPTVNDDSGDGYSPGSVWVDVTNDRKYVCLDASVGAAVWLEVMDRGDYDADADGDIDPGAGGTGIDSSGETGIPHVSSGTWSVLSRLSPGADSELTISSGAVTVTQLYHRIDTEGDAASDDLTTISGLANDGEIIVIHPESDARTVVLKHGTGNIYIPGGSDITLDDAEYHVMLMYDAESSAWCVIAGGGGGGGTGDVTGPASSTDNGIATYDGTGGKTLQSTGITIDDNDKMTHPDSGTYCPINFTERSSPPSSPSAGDIYLDDGTNTATGSPGWRRYDGAAWEDIGATGAGGTDSNAVHDNVASEVHSITEKASPVDADEVIIEDSEDSYNKKRAQLGNLPGGGGGDETHTAAYASRPSPSNAGDLFLPSDGFVLERDTGAAWVPWGPIFPLTAPPSSGWSWVNQGTATVTAAKGGIHLLAPAVSGDQLRVRTRTAPSTPYTITALVLVQRYSVDYSSAGLAWRQSSDGKLVVFTPAGNDEDHMSVIKFNSPTSNAGNYGGVASPIVSGLIWLRIADDGTDRTCSWSFNGQNFFEFHSVGRTDFLTADEVGFYASSNNANYPTAITLLSWEVS